MATTAPARDVVRYEAAGFGVVLTLAGLAFSAGTIHLVAAVQHAGISWQLGAFFAIVAAAQLAAADQLHGTLDNRSMLTLVAAGSVVVALLWIFSRTTGLPFGPDAGEVSSVGVADSIATVQELALAGLIAARTSATTRLGAMLNSPMGVRLAICVLSVSLLVAALGGHQH